MPYPSDLDQVQIGTETTWGTAVTPTAKLALIEECEIEPEIEVSNLSDKRGSLAGSFVRTLDSHKGSGSLKGTPTYEDIQYYLDSILGQVTPSGAGPYVYAGAAPLTATPTRRKITLVKGQTGSVDKLAGGLVDEFTLSIESNKPWSFEAKLAGKAVSSGTLALLSDRTQTPIHANQTTIYIDAWNGTIGTTTITSTFYSLELSVKANINLMPGIGSLNPANYSDAAYEGALKMTIEADAATGAYLTSILGTTLLQQQIRIKATTGATQIAQFDFAGAHVKSPKLHSDKDGVKTFEFEMENLYHSTLANWLKTSITNSVSVLP